MTINKQKDQEIMHLRTTLENVRKEKDSILMQRQENDEKLNELEN